MYLTSFMSVVLHIWVH